MSVLIGDHQFYHGEVKDPDHFFRNDPQGHQEYATKVISVLCDLCDATGRGSEQSLRASRWELGYGFAFCPNH